MSQKTVRISAGFSDKVSENYNSTSYSINLEMDAQINGSTTEIEQASDRLFQLCRKIVNHQKGVSVDTLLVSQEPSQQLPPPQAVYTQSEPPQTFTSNLASEKQVKCVFAVAKGRSMSNDAINGLAQRFGKIRLEELSSQEASSLIKELKN